VDREGRISPFESLINEVQNVLTVAELRGAIKTRYHDDYRYKPVEGAPPVGSAPPPVGSAPPPAAQQQQGATCHFEKVATNEENSKNKEEVVEGATSHREEEVQEGGTYLRGPITRPLDGVKTRQTVAESLEKFRTTAVEKEEEEEDVLQLLNSSEESMDDTDSFPPLDEAQLYETLTRVKQRGPGLKDC
jgi:hypothetical protein